MIDYTHLYHILFNAITDALESMDPDSPAAFILRDAQLKTEELYLDAE